MALPLAPVHLSEGFSARSVALRGVASARNMNAKEMDMDLRSPKLRFVLNTAREACLLLLPLLLGGGLIFAGIKALLR
jgi:hypothetical protein